MIAAGQGNCVVRYAGWYVRDWEEAEWYTNEKGIRILNSRLYTWFISKFSVIKSDNIVV